MSRTALLYGALLGALQVTGTLLVYAFGLHDSPDSLEGAARFESLAAFVAMMAALCLGLRALRLARSRDNQPFTFRFGAQATLVIAGVGALVTALGQYIYFTAINPAYAGHIRSAYLAGTQLTPEQAQAYAWQLDFLSSPAFHVVRHSIVAFFFSLMIGLLYAFLFRDRPAPRPAGAG